MKKKGQPFSNSHYGERLETLSANFVGHFVEEAKCLKTARQSARQSGRRRHANGHNENCWQPLDEPGQQWLWKITLTIVCVAVGATR